MREAHTICSPTTSGPETPMKTWPALTGSEKTSQQEERGCTTVCQHLHSFLRTNSLPSAHREKSTENKWKGQSPIPQQCPCVTWGWLFSQFCTNQRCVQHTERRAELGTSLSPRHQSRGCFVSHSAVNRHLFNRAAVGTGVETEKGKKKSLSCILL